MFLSVSGGSCCLGRKQRPLLCIDHERKSPQPSTSTPEGIMCFFSLLESMQLCCEYLSMYLLVLWGSEDTSCVLLLSIILGTSEKGIDYRGLLAWLWSGVIFWTWAVMKGADLVWDLTFIASPIWVLGDYFSLPLTSPVLPKKKDPCFSCFHLGHYP